MRKIKFRGKTIGGQIVFGSYYYENLDDIGEIHSIIDEHGEENVVYPESVAQLIGYDKNGKEVYEGDTVVGEDGIQWDADWSYILISDDGFEYSLDLEFFTLKEDKQ